MKLGELLVRKRLISQDQLDQLLAIQPTSNRPLGEILIERSMISADTLSTLLQEQYWRNNGFWVIG